MSLNIIKKIWLYNTVNITYLTGVCKLLNNKILVCGGYY